MDPVKPQKGKEKKKVDDFQPLWKEGGRKLQGTYY